jgi:hypothetical protein
MRVAAITVGARLTSQPLAGKPNSPMRVAAITVGARLAGDGA